MRHNRLLTMLLVFLIDPAAALTGACLSMPPEGSDIGMTELPSMIDTKEAMEAKVAPETFQITAGKGAIRIIAATDDLFETDHTTLQADARSDLSIIADALMSKIVQMPQLKHKFFISAYTDDQGDKKANEALSTQQAEVIAETLQSAAQSAGVRDQLQVFGDLGFKIRSYGEGHPVTPNTSADNRALNRRIKIIYAARLY